MPTEEDRAYLAGLLDGEGHIGITIAKQRPNGREWRTHVVIVTVASTYIPVLSWVQEHWTSGSLVVRRSKPGYPPIGSVRWSSAAAGIILREVLPYMRIKVAQARIAIQFADELAARPSRSRTISPEEWARREELRVALRQINRPDPAVVVEPYPFSLVELTCVRCGQPMAAEKRAGKKYCSTKCRNAVAWQNYKAKHSTT